MFCIRCMCTTENTVVLVSELLGYTMHWPRHVIFPFLTYEPEYYSDISQTFY